MCAWTEARSHDLSTKCQALYYLSKRGQERFSAFKIRPVSQGLYISQERFTHLDNVTDTLRRNLSVLTTDHTTISSDHANMADVYTSDQFKTSVAQVVNTVVSAVKIKVFHDKFEF